MQLQQVHPDTTTGRGMSRPINMKKRDVRSSLEILVIVGITYPNGMSGLVHGGREHAFCGRDDLDALPFPAPLVAYHRSSVMPVKVAASRNHTSPLDRWRIDRSASDKRLLGLRESGCFTQNRFAAADSKGDLNRHRSIGHTDRSCGPWRERWSGASGRLASGPSPA